MMTIPTIAIGAAVTVALAASGVTGYRMGGASARAELQAFYAKAFESSLRAESQQRQIEKNRADAAQKGIEDAHHQLAQARAHAAAADRAADGLRQRANALVAAAGHPGSHPGAAGNGAGVGHHDPIVVLAGVLDRVESNARSVTEYADHLRIAGAACERQYDAVKGPEK
jgi:hypothetical protein